MAKNLLVINVDIRETRVALIENGIIAELHIERETSKGTLGNIYLGKVSRVLPGMQAAFIDVGLERAAFLHVEDLIRPDDFEAYLAGHNRGTATTDEDRSSGPPPEEAVFEPEPTIELPTAMDVLADSTTGDLIIAAEEGEPVEADDGPDEALVAAASEDDDEQLVAAGFDGDDDDAADTSAAAEAHAAIEDDDEPFGFSAETDEAIAAEPAHDEAGFLPVAIESGGAMTEAAIDAGEGEPVEGAAIEAGAQIEGAAIDAGEAGPVEGAAIDAGEGGLDDPSTAPRARARRNGRAGRVRRSGRTRDRQPLEGAEGAVATPAPVPVTPAPAPAREGEGRGRGGREGRSGGREGRSGGREGGRSGGREGRSNGREGQRTQAGRTHSHEPPRVSKTTPIREVIREGQEVLVQISKEPIGTKGARVTSHISLPGRYVVFLPTVDHIGISKRIGSEKERSRLRESIEAMKPPSGGLIVRTLAEGLTKKQLKADVGYLVRLWGEVVNRREAAPRPPAPLYTELDLVLKTARDLFSDDIEKIVIDDRAEYDRLKRFVEMFMPERAHQVELYEGEEPIFDAYGIEDEIGRALSRKVPLASGGHLIIDQAEALTAIDVNTGRFVGKGSKDLEETILTTNLEAVEEIAYQLRFRNIGGLIILDLIDMERAQNREKVRKRLEGLLSKDKAKTTLNRISELGLIEMTRKRTRESLGRMIHEPCFYCDGTGQLQSKQTVAYEILRQIRRERMNLRGYVIVVNAHPAVVDLLKNEEKVAVVEAERLFTRRIELIPRKEYHLEQFDLLGK